MNQQLKNDLTQIETLLQSVKEQGIAYLNNLHQRATTTKPFVEQNSGLPPQGIGTLQALQHFSERLEPMMVATAGPRYWGFVTGGTTPAALVGDWLTSVYDQNAFATTGQGDISALIELETISLLLDLLNLPKTFLGGFVTGATMSNFTCLAVARQWLGQELGKDFAKEGVSGAVKVLTATPHSSSIKSLSMLGLGSNNFTQIPTLPGNREARDVAALEKEISNLNGQPFILISSGGTVNTVDFDDFKAIAQLKEKNNFWWHIDAAFGGFAVCSTTHSHLLTGWELADSITLDCHKWLNVPYESAVFFVAEKHKHRQVETFQNSNAPYLGNPLDNFSYLNFLPENSRRLKALPVWFSLMAYGQEGFRDIVDNSIQVATYFGQFIEESTAFALLAPVRLNTVCFTLKGDENQSKVQSFLTSLNSTGKVFMTPTIYKSQPGIRAAFVNWRTNLKDVDVAIDEMQRILNLF